MGLESFKSNFFAAKITVTIRKKELNNLTIHYWKFIGAVGSAIINACEDWIPKETDHFDIKTLSEDLRTCSLKLILVTKKTIASVTLNVFIAAPIHSNLILLSSLLWWIFSDLSIEYLET